MDANEPSMGRYRHYKGGLYEVIGIATHTETAARYVVYMALKDDSLWVRPLDMFMGTVELEGKTVPRFSSLDIMSE